MTSGWKAPRGAAVGDRKYRACLVGVVACLVVALAGMRMGKDPRALAVLVGAVSAPVAWFVAGSVGEWIQRRKDPSSIAEQVSAEKSPGVTP